MDTNKYFPNSHDFLSQNFDYFTPKVTMFGPIKLDIITNIVS